ncbi:MAG: hypothetical protein E7148_07405 [Rikenellaceae bacterium]|nr:hypothetical protein [Rikenellaceae bacterium]
MQLKGVINSRISKPMRSLHNHLVRICYFRGHGVHSPFVYDLVRQVFMRRELLSGDHKLYQALREIGVSHHRAIQLQNLAIHCGYQTFSIDCAGGDLCIASKALSRTELFTLAQEATAQHTTIAVLAPYADNERQLICRQLETAHQSTTVDNRGYLLIFNNHLPKQHFRI